MSAKGKFTVAAAVLVLLLVIAGFVYADLTADVTSDSVPLTEIEEVPETGVDAEEPTEHPFAADFRMLDAEGNEWRLVDFVGQPILLNFWASWCPPCKAELPLFEEAYEQYGDQIQILMVDLCDGVQETKKSAMDFIAEGSYTFPVYFDTSGGSISAYHLYGLPMTVAIDSAGRVVRTQTGALSEETFSSMLNALVE